VEWPPATTAASTTNPINATTQAHTARVRHAGLIKGALIAGDDVKPG
jgi:hypothetical protein